jgi:hypothetical protein
MKIEKVLRQNATRSSRPLAHVKAFYSASRFEATYMTPILGRLFQIVKWSLTKLLSNQNRGS